MMQQSGTVRVALLDIHTLDEARALTLLPPARLEQALRCRRPDDRLRSAAAGLLLVWYTRLLGFSRFPAIDTQPEGKPFFPDAPQAQFSLSHSGSFAALAASGQPVGIDLQQLRPIRTAAARRFFTAEEQAELAALPQTAQTDAFFRLWVRKESYGKLTGHGLRGAGTASLSCRSAAVPGHPELHFHTPAAPDGHYLCVCAYDAVCAAPQLLTAADVYAAAGHAQDSIV